MQVPSMLMEKVTSGMLLSRSFMSIFWVCLISMTDEFGSSDLKDTTGTLYSMAKFAGLRDPVTLDFENSTIAYCVDAFSISMGALMGTSPVTAYVESATGISGTSF